MLLTTEQLEFFKGLLENIRKRNAFLLASGKYGLPTIHSEHGVNLKGAEHKKEGLFLVVRDKAQVNFYAMRRMRENAGIVWTPFKGDVEAFGFDFKKVEDRLAEIIKGDSGIDGS